MPFLRFLIDTIKKVYLFVGLSNVKELWPTSNQITQYA